MKLAQGRNATGCRLLAKEYLRCRMENNLMTEDSWDNLGLPEDDETTVTYSAALSKMAAKNDPDQKASLLAAATKLADSKPADSKPEAGSGSNSSAN